MDCRCVQCGASFKASAWVKQSFDPPLCDACQQHEDRVYQNNPLPYVSTEPWALSKAAMRERLGVTGNEDV